MKFKKFKIEQRELKFTIIGAALIIIWFTWLSYKIAPILEKIPPILAMIIYNIGLLALLFFLSNILIEKKQKFKISILAFIIILGLDILNGPYLVTANGGISTTAEYWYVAVDAGFANLASYIVPTSMIWTFTYIIIPIILIFIIPIIILNPKQIHKKIVGEMK